MPVPIGSPHHFQAQPKKLWSILLCALKTSRQPPLAVIAVCARRAPAVFIAGLLAMSALLSQGVQAQYADSQSQDAHSQTQDASGQPLERTGAAMTGPDSAVVIDMREPAPSDPVEPEQALEDSVLVQEYRQAILAAERRDGAYAATLPEQLLGLATALQELQRHEEASEALKRGVHLSRINSGLYSAEQIALLESEIESLRALGDYQRVDERQSYLYRVQQAAIDDQRELSDALMRQAQWQREAYLLGLGEESERATRLLLMWDLYRMALRARADAFGQESLALREPLLGMVETQYLVSRNAFFAAASPGSGADVRLTSMNIESYRRGETVLKALVELSETNNMSGLRRASDLVALGDWALWSGRREAASQYYADTLALLDELENSEAIREQLFGVPTLLPTFEDLHPFPAPRWDDQGDIALGFSVSEGGRTDDVERLARADVQESSVQNALYRALRGAFFRPRFEDGKPVKTQGMIWSWAAPAVEGKVRLWSDM